MRRVDMDDIDIDVGGCYLYEGEAFTGEVVEVDKSGRIVGLTTVERGLAHGPDLTWYPNGQLQSEVDVVRGISVGISRSWHPNGQLAEELHHRAGGAPTARRWDEEGNLIPPRRTGGPPG
jgi:antitoxin component YwqK of YwqJK toxin-antitoxin module